MSVRYIDLHHPRLCDLLQCTKGQVVLGRKTEGTSKIEITIIKDVLADDLFMEGCVTVLLPSDLPSNVSANVF
jgi:hypothetical protein